MPTDYQTRSLKWPLTLHRFLLSFRRRDDWHRHPIRKSLRYLALAMTAPAAHARWLTLLDSSEAFRLAVRRDSRLLERWQHRSINLRFWARQRLSILASHYQHLKSLLPEASLYRLYAEGEWPMASDTTKDGHLIQLLLALPVVKTHEGELNIIIRIPQCAQLYAMTVTLDPGHDRLLIGCLQGPSTADGLELVKMVTRDCHGLRPKNLLLSAAFALAKVAGLRRVMGVSNQAHAWSRSASVQASYDTFWQESGGLLGRDGFFDLGGHEPHRDELDVSSKRRAAFRQREQLRHSLVRQLGRSFPKRPPALRSPTQSAQLAMAAG